MFKNQSLKNTAIILCLIVCVLGVAQYFVYVDIKNMNQSSSQLSNDLSLQSNKEDYMISTGKLIQSLEGDINRINNSIVSSSGDVQYIESLEKLASGNNLEINIDSISTEDIIKTATSSITMLKIKASAKGGWSGTYKFLKQIESTPVKVKLNSYSFLSSGSGVVSDTPIKSTGPSDWSSSFEIGVLKYK